MKNALIAVLILTALFVGCAPEGESDYNENLEQIAQNDGLEATQVVNRISPPMESVNVPAENFEVEASEGERVVFENGTEITIPAGSLVDENGLEVSGSVDFSYREFHNVADVLLSGIPMSYDSAGVGYNFQTAGMMEIRASQNGKPVYIADGKEIEVKLASFVDEDGYNLYSLNEETGAWTFEEVSSSQPNPAAEADVDVSKLDLPAEPYKPQLLQPGETPFEFDVDYSEYPDLAPFKDLVWQLAKVEEEGVVKASEVDAVFGEIWNSARVEEHKRRKGLFYLTLSGDSKEAKMLVTPVVEEENFEKAMAVYAEIKRKQDERKAQLIAEARARENRLQRQARIQRVFSVSSFGIYNCDRIYRMPPESQMQVFASYEVEDFDGDVENLFLVMRDGNAVVPLSYYNKSYISYSNAEPTMILGFLPNNQVVVYGEEKFNEEKPSGEFTFTLERTGKKIKTADDLKSIIGA